MKKKIVRIITRMNIGGPSLHVVNLSKGLEDKYETVLLAGQIETYESDMSYYAKKKNVKVGYLSKLSRELKFPQDLIAFWEIFKILRKEKPDIVHTHMSKAGSLGRLAAWFAGVPIIVHTFHGNIFKGLFSEKKVKLFVSIERFLAKISSQIIAISETQKEELMDFKVAKSNKISVIKLGFDFNNILPNNEDYGVFRNEYGYKQDDILIPIVGRVTHQKCHKLYLEIADRICKKYNNVYFPIIGDGELRDEVEQEIQQRNIAHRVKVTGFIKDLKPVYADIDISILTSVFEGTPVALIEAMAAGKVVVSTNVGGIQDFIDNGVNGFYFDEPNPDLFVECLSKLIEDKENLTVIGEKARITSQKMFSVERLVKDINQLYDNLLDNKKL